MLTCVSFNSANTKQQHPEGTIYVITLKLLFSMLYPCKPCNIHVNIYVGEKKKESGI